MGSFEHELGERLKAARMLLGLSQKQVAAEIFTTAATVCYQEYGKRSVSIEALLRYCRLYNVPVAELLKGMEEYL